MTHSGPRWDCTPPVRPQIQEFRLLNLLLRTGNPDCRAFCYCTAGMTVSKQQKTPEPKLRGFRYY